jgi:hypothetical protein
MKYNITTGAAALAVAAMAVSSDAHALEYSYRVVADHTVVIDAQGVFMPDEADAFNAWKDHLAFRLLPPNATGPYAHDEFKVGAFVFNSPGGNVSGGMDLAQYIEKYRFNTGVAAGGRCASICVATWAAGAHKSATPDTNIGVHAASYHGDASALPQGAMVSNLEVKTTKAIAGWLAAHGAPQSVVNAAVHTSPADIHWVTQDELTAWSVKITW